MLQFNLFNTCTIHNILIRIRIIRITHLTTGSIIDPIETTSSEP